MRRSHMIVTVLALLAAIATPALAQGADEAAWRSSLTIGVATEGDTFDPHINVTSVSAQRMHMIYESLIQHRPDGEFVPLLAESWSISEDGKHYTFQLREGVRFSDGAPFDAEAIRFNFERLFSLGRGPVSQFSLIDEIVVAGPLTVEFVLSEPYPPFLAVLAGSEARLFMSPAAVRANATADDPWATAWAHLNTAGTGAYVLAEWQPEDRVVLAANQNFREPWSEDAITRVTYRLVREPSTSVQMFLRGDLDALETVPLQFRDLLAQNAAVRIVTEASIGGRHQLHIFVNNAHPPLDNLAFRQALAHALDYDRIMHDGFEGQARQARGSLPSSFTPWFNPEATQYTRDLERARELIAASGVATPVELQLVWRSDFREERTIGEIIQSNLREIGVNVTLVEQTLPVWRETIWGGNAQIIFFTQTGRFADPDSILYRYYHSTEIRPNGFNVGYRNDRVDQLMDLARIELDIDQRIAYYHELQQIITDEAANLFMADLLDAFAVAGYVQGVEFNPNYSVVFDAFRLHKDPAAR